jgi:hypothetical protein
LGNAIVFILSFISRDRSTRRKASVSRPCPALLCSIPGREAIAHPEAVLGLHVFRVVKIIRGRLLWTVTWIQALFLGTVVVLSVRAGGPTLSGYDHSLINAIGSRLGSRVQRSELRTA